MKKLQRLFAVLLCLMIAIVGFVGATNKVSAASYPNKISGIRKGAVLKYNGYDSLYYKTNSNYKLFCTNFHTPNVGSSCTLSSSQWSEPVQAGVAAAIKKYNSGKSQKNYYYTELAINEFLYYYGGKNSVNRISTTRDVRSTAGVSRYYNAAVSGYNKASKKFNFKITNSKLTFSESGNYYVSNKITVKDTNGNLSKYSASVSGAKGAKIYNKSGNSFYVRVPKSSVGIGKSVIVKVSVEGTKSYDVAKRYDCGSGNQKLTPNITTTANKTKKDSISGTITKKGNKLIIYKRISGKKTNLSGAKLVLKNSKGKVISKWTSTTKGKKFTNLDADTYTLSEESAPEGYVKTDKKVKIKVALNGKTIEVVMENTAKKLTGVKVIKIDSSTKKALKGAKLVVKNSNGKVVDSWTTDGKEHTIKNLAKGTYKLSEESAPEGYVKTNEVKTFKVNNDSKVIKLTVENTQKNITTVKVIKIDSKTKKALKGAKLVVKNSNGKVVDSWTTDGKEHTIKNLAKGTYKLSEESAPEGYVKTNEVKTFKVNNDSKVIKLTVENTLKNLTKVKAIKIDADTKEALKGAKLVVKNSNGKVVDSWITDGKEHTIKNLAKGTYTLSETEAPEGYVKTDAVETFKVNNDDKTITLKVLNTKVETKVEIIKIDSKTKKAVAGAKLVIKDSDGNVKDSWESTLDAHNITGLAKGTYTLSEAEAPEGYELSKEEITFEVKYDGKTVKVEMENKPVKIPTKARISKQSVSTGQELPGAHLVIRDSNGNIVKEWVSTNEPQEFELDPGTYTLSETIAPEGYQLKTETIEFEVKEDGTVTEVVMYNSPLEVPPVTPQNPDTPKYKVVISKQDITSKEELPGATLVVKDSDGNEVQRWVSGNTPKEFYLEAGDYTLTEIQAPNGYDLSYEVIDFTVKADSTVTTEAVMYNSKTPDTADKNIVLVFVGLLTTSIGSIFGFRKFKKQL